MLVSPFVVVHASGTTRKCTNGIATALPLCRSASADSYSGPAPRLRLFKHPRDKSRAPGITPAARALPRLEPVFIWSVTSLDQESPRASLPHVALTTLITRRLPPAGMFAFAYW